MAERKPRFRVGFEDIHVRADIAIKNPGMVPVVDLEGTRFAFGQVVALAIDDAWARIIVDALNRTTQ